MSFPHDAFTGTVHPEVRDYMARLGGDADPLLDRLEAHAAERGFPLIGRESGRWLELMTRAIGGRVALFADPRLRAGVLPVGDGLALGLKL